MTRKGVAAIAAGAVGVVAVTIIVKIRAGHELDDEDHADLDAIEAVIESAEDGSVLHQVLRSLEAKGRSRAVHLWLIRRVRRAHPADLVLDVAEENFEVLDMHLRIRGVPDK